MPGHSQNRRRKRVSLIAQPLGGAMVMSGLAFWEATRLAAARATVPSGWGAGIVAGAGAGLALAVLCGRM